jgi:uncharacterized membrane protein YidH (DUF202 family)
MKYPANRIHLIRQLVLLFLTLATLTILAVGTGSQYAQNKRSMRLVDAATSLRHTRCWPKGIGHGSTKASVIK